MSVNVQIRVNHLNTKSNMFEYIHYVANVLNNSYKYKCLFFLHFLITMEMFYHMVNW